MFIAAAIATSFAWHKTTDIWSLEIELGDHNKVETRNIAA